LLVAKLSVVAVLAARLLAEEAFRLAFNVSALVPVVVFVPEEFAVLLVDEPPLDALWLLAAVPTLDDVLPPLAELLLNDELPIDPALPLEPALTVFAVEPEDDVELVPFELFADAPSVAPSVWLLLAVKEPLFENALVVPLDLLEFSAAAFVVALDLLELSAATFVVPLDLFEVAAKLLVVPLAFMELSEAEDASEAVKLLLAPACCIFELLELNVSEELFVSERSLEYILLLLLVAFSEELMLDADVFDLVLVELSFNVSWLFCPR
jgi:hypothetical protein